MYHANSEPGQGWGRKRLPRAQKFTWNKNGTPNFGEPVKTGTAINIPSDRKVNNKKVNNKKVNKINTSQ